MDKIKADIIDLLEHINRPDYLIKLLQYAALLASHESVKD